ncbi:4'-phosphopantetheinyl transferase superfamily protein [Streptomyces sp. NPDC007027]|uniref:4'-phosphopantetheinyl transferase superfamily protein n=1 Tax=unclassified Streptomyces TaxID=2593676 RepID=UPI003404B339
MTAEPELPVGVAAQTALGFHPVPWPHGPAEQFAAGRRAAAAALASAGSAHRAVPRAPDGRPVFPREFPGSISHTERLAVAAVAPGARAVGVDIEDTAVTERMARFVFHRRERQTLLAPAGEYSPGELFVAKEAAFKALNTIAALGDFVFWQIELSRSGDALRASYGGALVPVRVRSQTDLSLAVAIRR